MDIESFLRKNNILKNIHRGKRCFILANGPSVINQDVLLLGNEIKIVVNNIHKHENIKQINPDYWTCVDPLFFKEYKKYFLPIIQTIEEKKLSVNMFLPINYIHNVNIIPNAGFLDFSFFSFDGKKNIDTEIDFTQNIPPYSQNVVIVAIMMAFFLGCNPIYLLGCDHTWWKFNRDTYADGVVEHSYKASPDKYSEHNSYDFIKSTIFVQKFQYLQMIKYAESRGFKIFNATEGGYLDLFPRVKYEDLFPKDNKNIDTKTILSHISDVSSELGKSAIKLMADEAWSSALVLLEEAISQNFHRPYRVEGLDYLKAVCMMNLGEYGEAEKSAHQDYICNPSNREKSSFLLDIIKNGQIKL